MKIHLEGTYNVDRAEELRHILVNAAREGGPLEVDLSRVDDADLSMFQLLHSVQRQIKPERFSILSGWNEDIGLKLGLTGFKVGGSGS
ncbi:MAG: STAS domain-containing protein [Deltaproteobacteria bacterium]|nr:STAS domain-containing protein [Deltaproteobacteria bacterium]